MEHIDPPEFPPEAFVECIGGSWEGFPCPMPMPELMRPAFVGALISLPPRHVYVAVLEAGSDDPASAMEESSSSWEHFVLRKREGGYAFVYDGQLDHVLPPSSPGSQAETGSS